MKKLLVLFAILAVAFAAPAMALDDQACKNCADKLYTCDLSNIRVGAEGMTVENGPDFGDTCNYFDYDGINMEGAVGYCDSDANENCKILFDICDCNDTSKFTEGNTIGIRMTILTPGVYFAHQADTLAFNKFSDGEYDDGTVCAASWDDPAFPERQSTFTGGFNYYDASDDLLDGPADMINGECNVPDEEKAVVMESVRDRGYTITADDVDGAVCCWWLDMPAMRYDLDEITMGDMVQVKIELLNRQPQICEEWEVICDCVVEIGELGCTPSSASEEGCFYFPYVLSGGNWATGVAVSNLSGLFSEMTTVTPAEMSILYTLVDGAGDVFTKLLSPGDVDTMVYTTVVTADGWTGGTPAPGAAMLKVETNFKSFGYSFLTDGNFGAGTLSKKCNSIPE